MAIHVDETALRELGEALGTAGEEYQTNLGRLQTLIDEITHGNIQGDPANDLLAKFQAKEEVFKKLYETINKANEYMGRQTTSFSDLITNLKSGMR